MWIIWSSSLLYLFVWCLSLSPNINYNLFYFDGLALKLMNYKMQTEWDVLTKALIHHGTSGQKLCRIPLIKPLCSVFFIVHSFLPVL